MSVKPAEKEYLRRLLSDLGAEENDVVYVDGLALKIDGSAASTSKLPFQSWFDFGWRNVAGAYSDMRVKYAEARHLLASVTAPDLATAEEVIAGHIRQRRLTSLLCIVGGDLNQGGDVVVDVVLVGRSTLRLGRVPRPGDVLIAISEFGYTSLAYRFWREDHPVVRKGVEALRRPSPLWPLPPPHCVTASMDSSDGLADVLWSMARGVDIVVKRLPVAAEVEAFALERGLDLEEVVFNGGEEYLPGLRRETRLSRREPLRRVCGGRRGQRRGMVERGATEMARLELLLKLHVALASLTYRRSFSS
jgi:thiamine-monophosphate kinase